MQELHGQKIADGCAMGLATFIEPRKLEIPSHNLSPEETSQELKRLQNAFEVCEAELSQMLSPNLVNASEREILNTHIEILNDPELKKTLHQAIMQDLQPAARAVDNIISATMRFFEDLDNDLFKQRAADYQDLGHKLISQLLGDASDSFAALNSEYIPIFSKISPSQVSLLHRKGVRAFITDSCSSRSHAAIISRALGLAVISGIPELRKIVKAADPLIVDADASKIIVGPDAATLELYTQRLQKKALILQDQESQKHSACITQDGVKVSLFANMGLPDELPGILKLDGDGIGLFRTEFIYLSRDTLPSEAEQYQLYRQVISEMAPKPVTIRSFDLGGDKMLHLIPSPPEDNPYLGNRGIRFSLSHPELFKTQLRAIIRASAFGKVKLMFPMVIDVEDFIAARKLFQLCVDEIRLEGHAYDSEIAIGSMIEVPSAALCADALAQECDFFSIGTNDLAQYTLAVDRNSELVSHYYVTHHPAVLKLIRTILNAAAKHHKPVSLCGEMASQREYVPLLIGMGITELSVNVSSHFSVKEVILRCDARLSSIVNKIDFLASKTQVEELIFHTLKPYYAKKRSNNVTLRPS